MMDYTKMTVQELQKELETLEQQKFYLDMCDHWTHDDYNYHHELTTKIQKVRNELRKRGVEE